MTIREDTPTAHSADASQEVASLLRRFSAKYCWDSTPDRALQEADRVIRRTFDVGTWDDTLELERVLGHPRLRISLVQSPPGSLTPRAWSFWHYRLGLADVDHAPPPQPARRVR